MKAYETKRHKEKLDSIYRKLLKFTNSNNFSKKKKAEAKIGDVRYIYSVIFKLYVTYL